MPRGRVAEDGPIPARYVGLVETESADPAVRTALNVRDSDATLIVSHGALAGGSLLTLHEATRASKPHLQVDLDELSLASASERLANWLAEIRPRVLNVAGPRASEDPRIASDTAALLETALPR